MSDDPEATCGVDVSDDVIDQIARVKFAPGRPPEGAHGLPWWVRAWKLAVLCLLGPVRFVLIIATAGGICFLCRLFQLGVSTQDEKEQVDLPLPPFRRSCVRFVAGVGARIVLSLFGVWWVDVRGSEHVPKRPRSAGVTIVANHISLLDSLCDRP